MATALKKELQSEAAELEARLKSMTQQEAMQKAAYKNARASVLVTSGRLQQLHATIAKLK